MQPSPACPEAEALAAFLDGRLAGDERTRMEAHLVACEVCYEVFTESARFLRDSATAEAPLPFPVRRRIARVLVPLAAAAGLAALLIRLAGPRPPEAPGRTAQASPSVATQPPSPVGAPPGPVERLASGASLRELVRSAWSEDPGAYGFAGTRTVAGRSLLIGVHRADLALALRADDLSAARAALERILGLLEPGSREASVYRGLLDDIAAGRGARTVPASEGGGRLDPDRVSLGEWLEAARLAAVVRDRGFLEAPDARERLRALARASPAAAKRVADVERLIAAGPAAPQDWVRLERGLADIMRMP